MLHCNFYFSFHRAFTFSVPPFLSFLSLPISFFCLSFTLYPCIYVFFSCFSFLSGYCFYCTSCVYSCNMHKTTNTKTEDKAAYCKINVCQWTIILGDKIASASRDWIRRLMGNWILQIRRNSKPSCHKFL